MDRAHITYEPTAEEAAELRRDRHEQVADDINWTLNRHLADLPDDIDEDIRTLIAAGKAKLAEAERLARQRMA